MRDYFRRLFEYDLWGHLRILDALLAHEVQDERCSYWLSHIFNARQIWLERIRDGHTVHPVHEVYPLHTLAARLEDSQRQWMAWLDAQPEHLSGTVAYQTSQGGSYENALTDLLAHVVNHGTHHRAQAAARLRELGIAPPPTDFLFYFR
ncbi:MAG: DinB family protein [Bacteroidia bacterium]|nr:DinB family protein [Bacteroidia bacterium]